MTVRRVQDPADFLDTCRTHLLADEARHNLILGLAGTLRDHSGIYPEFDLWVVERGGDVFLAALRTPPYNLVLSRPLEAAALGALADALSSERVTLPGVTAAVPEAEEFANLWCSLADVSARKRMAQRVYSLQRVRPVRDIPGCPRAATTDDRAFLVEWLEAFTDEALPPDAPRRAAENAVDARLEAGAGGFELWDVDRSPVSLAGWGGETPNGIRIGPVYTPPEHRRRGYASALTAAVSADRLAEGRSFCFLYTDLSNPTSNRIYIDIGYEPVCDSHEYAFETPLTAKVVE
jgi:predicted GNAT family acetyltransferase